MKKILILGGSHRDIPLIEASKELGYYVITLGDRAYYLGHNYSDKKYLVDFNDLDKVREIMQKEGIEYIVSGCGEASYMSTVILANEFGICNYDRLETAKLIHNKWLFKKFCLENKISVPNGFFYKKGVKVSNLDFPIVVKTTSLSAGQGIEIVYDKTELNKAIKNAFNYSDEVFLEEYIEGDLVAYSVFIENQRVIFGFMGRDEVYLNRYLVAYAYPENFDNKVKNRLDKDINTIAQKLNLVDGMFHLQVIIKDNMPYIIDVTRRIPGELYPRLIEYSKGVKYSQAVIKGYLGEKLKDEFQVCKNEFIIRYVVMPSKNGIYKNIDINKKIKDKIIDRFDMIKEGYRIEDYLSTQLSILFIKLDKNDSMILQNIKQLILVNVC